MAELAEQFDLHPNQIQDWKQKLMAQEKTVFGAGTPDTMNNEQLQQKLHAKIGQVTMEKDF